MRESVHDGLVVQRVHIEDGVASDFGERAALGDEARKCIDYVERNRERMRYPEFRAAGALYSTGVVEAGCKVAIGTRCKRAGMHWTVAGVDAIIALRCCKLSGRFEEFWSAVLNGGWRDDRFSSHNPDVRPPIGR